MFSGRLQIAAQLLEYLGAALVEPIYARRVSVQAFPLMMLALPPKAALMRTTTPDAFIPVFVQPKLMRVCIVHAWVKYEAGPALRVVPLHLSCSMIQFVVD